uniref:Uncharacterized protein n=1 Tax=Arundo donax TaxID=35708 RepID=A0A0A9G819_ARUDO
MYTSSSSAS